MFFITLLTLPSLHTIIFTVCCIESVDCASILDLNWEADTFYLFIFQSQWFCCMRVRITLLGLIPARSNGRRFLSFAKRRSTWCFLTWPTKDLLVEMQLKMHLLFAIPVWSKYAFIVWEVCCTTFAVTGIDSSGSGWTFYLLEMPQVPWLCRLSWDKGEALWWVCSLFPTGCDGSTQHGQLLKSQCLGYERPA